MAANTIIALGATFAGLSVAFGAFGAHALKQRLTPDMLDIFHTAVQYQFYHSLALVLLGLFVARTGSATGAAWAFTLGILVFSGSLYVLALTGMKWLGAITPIGGVAFMVGWALFAWSSLQGPE